MHNNNIIRFIKNVLLVMGLIFLSYCGTKMATNPNSEPPSHAIFNSLLNKYVDKNGMVNYKGFQNERAKFKKYLSLLEENAPNEKWTKNEILAYWINTYNAFTLELILEHYPVESIREIGSTINIPFVSSGWDIKFIKIGEETYDLNNIEHGIIRKQFDEPRIHFALVCAAVSCPKLRNETYEPNLLDFQLSSATKNFLADTTKNEFKSAEQAELSKIFSWYKEDFTKNSSLVDFLNKYGPTQLKKNVKISHMEYDWALNEQ